MWIRDFFAGAAVLFFRYFCARYFFKEYLNTAVLICFKDVFCYDTATNKIWKIKKQGENFKGWAVRGKRRVAVGKGSNYQR